MNDLDRLIQEKIKTEYANIAPSKDSLHKIKQGVKGSMEKKANNMWAKYYRVAAVIIIAILVFVNSNSIKAFVMNLYEKYLASLVNQYQEKNVDYAKDLDLTVEIEDTIIIVEQYVITNKGVDFKIMQPQEGNVELVGYEINLEDKDCMRQEALIKSNGYYIASNIFETGSWDNTDKQVKGTLEIMYLDESSNAEDTFETELKSVSKEVTLDISDIYQCEEITNKYNEILVDEEYTVTSISLNNWYMKITYDPVDAWDGKSLLNIEQDGEQLLFLGGNGNDEEVCAYYQLPKNTEDTLNISLANIIFDQQRSIEIVGETHKLRLKDCLKEEK